MTPNNGYVNELIMELTTEKADGHQEDQEQ